ncbi:hypothetical protein, partial [Parabacteroides bouchesdurhonensis]
APAFFSERGYKDINFSVLVPNIYETFSQKVLLNIYTHILSRMRVQKYYHLCYFPNISGTILELFFQLFVL